MNLKKKVGPLPAWAWLAIAGATIGIFLLYRSRAASSSGTPSADTVDPTNPLGLTYGQEASDQASGIDPLTGATYASEQPAANVPDSSGGGSSGGADSGTDPGTGDPYGAEILAAINGIGLTDNPTAGQTFLGEVQDVIAGKKLLDQLFPPGTAPPAAPGTVTGTSEDKKPGLPGTYKDSKKTSKSNGSGGAGAAGSGGAGVGQRTVKHTPPKSTKKPKSTGSTRTVIRGKKH